VLRQTETELVARRQRTEILHLAPLDNSNHPKDKDTDKADDDLQSVGSDFPDLPSYDEIVQVEQVMETFEIPPPPPLPQVQQEASSSPKSTSSGVGSSSLAQELANRVKERNFRWEVIRR